MRAGPPNDSPQDMRVEENDPVWHLLGESPRPQPSAWFTARALARCREVGQAAEAGALCSFNGMWRWALGGGMGVCLAVFLMAPRPLPYSHPAPATNQQNVQEAFAIMASIGSTDSDSDSDPDSDSSSSWQDSSSL